MGVHLPEIRLAVDSGMVVLIWLVQLIIYPAFQSFDPNRFKAAHKTYMASISWIVMPLMFLQAGAIALQLASERSASNWISATAVGIAWGATFLFSVPCHNTLQRDGHDPDQIGRLVKTNWIRTICWTLAFVAGRF